MYEERKTHRNNRKLNDMSENNSTHSFEISDGTWKSAHSNLVNVHDTMHDKYKNLQIIFNTMNYYDVCAVMI